MPKVVNPEPEAEQAAKEACAELERLVLSSVNCYDTGDRDHQSEAGQEFRSRISKDFKGKLDGYYEFLSWEDLIQIGKDCDVNDMKIQIGTRHVSSNVDLKKCVGVVYLERLGSDGRTGLKATGVTEFRWRLEDGRWMLYYWTLMKGITGVTGVD